MTLEDLADLIRANSASANGRIDPMRNEVNAALMTVQNDFTDVRGEIKEIGSALGQVRRSLDLAATVAEVAELKRRAS